MILTSFFIFISGAVIGSFLNVCIYRLPLGQSVITPGSHCPHCKSPIRFYDNIPVISFIILRGRCRSCGTPISFQYVIVEVLNGIGYILIALKFGFTVEAALYALLFSALLIVSVIDIYFKIIPDIITLPGIITGLIASAFILPAGIKGSVIGALLGSSIFFIIAVVSRGGMGGGDIKLIAMIGAFLGWMGVIITIILSSFIGSVAGITLMIFLGKGRKYPVPFGPFLSLGGILSLFFNREIIEWYIGMSL